MEKKINEVIINRLGEGLDMSAWAGAGSQQNELLDHPLLLPPQVDSHDEAMKETEPNGL